MKKGKRRWWLIVVIIVVVAAAAATAGAALAQPQQVGDRPLPDLHRRHGHDLRDRAGRLHAEPAPTPRRRSRSAVREQLVEQLVQAARPAARAPPVALGGTGAAIITAQQRSSPTIQRRRHRHRHRLRTAHTDELLADHGSSGHQRDPDRQRLHRHHGGQLQRPCGVLQGDKRQPGHGHRAGRRRERPDHRHKLRQHGQQRPSLHGHAHTQAALPANSSSTSQRHEQRQHDLEQQRLDGSSSGSTSSSSGSTSKRHERRGDRHRLRRRRHADTLQRLLTISGKPMFAFVSATPLYKTLSTSLASGTQRPTSPPCSARSRRRLLHRHINGDSAPRPRRRSRTGRPPRA